MMDDVCYVHTKVVSCDGNMAQKEGAFGHPRVYLPLGKDLQVACPYCSCLFVYREKGEEPSSSSSAIGIKQ